MQTQLLQSKTLRAACRPVGVCYQRSHFSGRCLPTAPIRQSNRSAPRQVIRMGLFGLGAPELAVIAGVVLLIYGPAKLPDVGKELGKTVKSFQSAAKEFEKELKEAAADDTSDADKKKD